MRGREREWEVVERLLRAAGAGDGGTLLVDGEPGAGKTRLLSEAAVTAAALGLDTVTAHAGELGEPVPYGMLFDALGLPPGDDALPRLRAALAARAAGPLLVTADDVQWCDPATLAVLCALHGELAGRPVAWLLARCTLEGGDHVRRLFDLLERRGAGRVTLAPLTPHAVAALLEDELGAPPDAPLAAFAGTAGGNPLLVTELLAGLREEGALRITRGRATLPRPHLPARASRLVRHWLGALGADARNLVETAAVLGRSFTPARAAALLGTTPAALLPAVEEALAAGILADAGHELTFRHELVRHVITETVPEPLRHALLDQGDEPPPPTERAPSPHPRQSVEAVDAAAAAGRLAEAERLARVALTRHRGARAAAELRCALSDVMFLDGRAPQAGREAEAALAVPGLAPAVRDRAVAARLAALTAQGGDPAREYARQVADAGGRHGERAALAALVTLAAAEWSAGRLSDGLALAAEARGLIGTHGLAAHHYEPHLTLAWMSTDVHHLEEAGVLLREAREDMAAHGIAAWAATAAALHARVCLAADRPEAAAADAEHALGLAAGAPPFAA
ncbi:ATP-binding protein, partial [Spongiactinospora sp. TRM90649]|uniref:ATP-binding protein n=1 Tax=Spongiactinospora sp. TRM90649 TaxID=3031114 RepID=UPI0023FA0BE1